MNDEEFQAIFQRKAQRERIKKMLIQVSIVLVAGIAIGIALLEDKDNYPELRDGLKIRVVFAYQEYRNSWYEQKYLIDVFKQMAKNVVAPNYGECLKLSQDLKDMKLRISLVPDTLDKVDCAKIKQLMFQAHPLVKSDLMTVIYTFKSHDNTQSIQIPQGYSKVLDHYQKKIKEEVSAVSKEVYATGRTKQWLQAKLSEYYKQLSLSKQRVLQNEQKLKALRQRPMRPEVKKCLRENEEYGNHFKEFLTSHKGLPPECRIKTK